jgi:ligand-binding sensor domain-containing protein
MSLRPLIALLFASAGSLFSAPSSHAAPASVPPLRIRSWGTEQGLPHPRITAIAQSNDGLLWLATPRGLVHFDGLTFRTPLGHASLVNRSITALEHSQRHQLWIGTADGSILAIDHSGLHNMGSVSSASIHGSITQLAEDAQGKLWIATSTGQVASLSGSSCLPESIAWTGTKDSRFSLHSTPDHSVVIGSESGLWKPNQQRLLPWAQPSLPPPWRFVAHGSGGQLWLGRAGHDLAIRNHAAASFSLNLPDDNSPISSAVDLDGSLWLTTPTGGLHCF